MTGDHAPERAERRAVLVLSIAAGVSAANLYYAQPMIPRMAESLGCTVEALGPALVLTQVGYALGMLFLVPLGDGRERRSLIVAMAFLTSLSLMAVACSTSPAMLAGASLVMGAATSIPQMAVPFAVGLSPPSRQPWAIGQVMAGVLAGILLSRTASGLASSVVGWRAVYGAASLAMIALGVFMRTLLPLEPPPVRLRLREILVSLAVVFRGDRHLQRHALLGALGFASFSVYWSTMASELFLRGLDSRTAALFALVGIAGVVVAPIVGRVVKKTGAPPINTLGLAAVSLSFGALYMLREHPFTTLPFVILLDAGVQASHLANMGVLLTSSGDRRGRINAVYMICYFAGGGVGSALGTFFAARTGWGGVTSVGALLSLVGALFYVVPEKTGAR